MKEIFLYFPNSIQEELKKYNLGNLEEIRIRNSRPIFLQIGQEEIETNYVIKSEDILETLQKICDNSIYTYQNQICNGYITIKGGHRVGITGSAVLKDGQVINISHVYSMNFRIAREIIDCSNQIIKNIINFNSDSIYNTLIVSPPGRGKTTILRDLVRKLSNDIKEYNLKGMSIGVVDERGEITAMYKGNPQNNIGKRTDILDNIPKSIGMKMLIRSMSPKIIVADEIGTREDVEAIKYAVSCGVKGIFTAHGSNVEDIIQNPILKDLYKENILERIFFIEKDRTLHMEYTISERRAI